LLTGIASSLAGNAVSLVAPLLVVPATFEYLGAEQYGMWMAVASLTSMAFFADLGLGNGLLTKLSRSFAVGDTGASARLIASAYVFLAGVAAVLLTVLTVVDRLVHWPQLLNAHGAAATAEARTVALICFGAFVVNVPLSLIQRVQYSRQQIARSNLWQALGSLASVALVLSAVAADLGATVVILCAVSAAPLGNLMNSLIYFSYQEPALRPRLDAFHLSTGWDLLHLGARFFQLSVLSSIALNVDNFLVARLLGLDEAAHYSIVMRLFGLLGLLVTLVNLPLWPTNAEALARGDVAWVRRNTRRMCCLSAGVVAVPGLLLVLTGNRVLEIWVRSDDLPPASTPLLAGLLAWSVLLALCSPLFMVQNSIGALRHQTIGWGAFLVGSVGLKTMLAHSVGLPGLPLAGFVAHLAFLAPAAVLGYRKALKQSGQAVPMRQKDVHHV
jgi:O-antigen/teichoic acid export membrane protein